MANGKEFDTLDDLFTELDKLVYTNNSFKVTADNVQEALKDVAKSIWIKSDLIDSYLDERKQFIPLYGGGLGFPYDETTRPKYYNYILNTSSKIGLYVSKNDTELTIFSKKNSFLNLTKQIYISDTEYNRFDNFIKPNDKQPTKNLTFQLPDKSGTLALLEDISGGSLSIEEVDTFDNSAYYIPGVRWYDENYNKLYYRKTGIRFRYNSLKGVNTETLEIGGSQNGITEKEGYRGMLTLKSDTGASNASYSVCLRSKSYDQMTKEQAQDQVVFEFPTYKKGTEIKDPKILATEDYVDTSEEWMENVGRTVPYLTSHAYSSSPVMMIMCQTSTGSDPTLPQGWQKAGFSVSETVMKIWGDLGESITKGTGVKIIFIERIPNLE